jgi:hypothetical protein
MKLPHDLLIKTRIAREGMKVREVFEECLHTGLQSMACANDNGLVTGRITLKHVINRSIPEYMTELAPILASDMATFEDMESRMGAVLDDKIDAYIQDPHAAIESDTSLIKALALMEHHDTSYLFVVDDGQYQGTLTVPGIAAWMMRMDRNRG